MKQLGKSILFLSALMLLASCSKTEKEIIISVKNTSNTDRTFETVELTKSFLNVKDLSAIGMLNTATNTLEVTQTVDHDNDSIMDVILFQPKIKAGSEVRFKIVPANKAEKHEARELCYSRFVPERTDDYAWENDKVAFRVFGPDAQYRFENNLKEGTLSSGVDAWLKKVEYSIINSWYKKYTEKTGSYHEDTGEGLDNFHVGKSRGIGGLAVKQDTTYYYSKNFIKWRTITTGPIRTSFYLEYESWNAGKKLVKESKIISLDKGSNLSKFDTTIDGVKTASAGLTLHEKDGKVTTNKADGWISYWQPHADSELGTAIIVPKDHVMDFETYNSAIKDLSNAYAHLKVINNNAIYYAGFGWKKSGQFKTKQDWENYLSDFAENLNTPLKVTRIK
ncbi:DUF4861 family protein [Tamlana sp. 2201CG12-4]|uniref:DUF4861 family protein n=1 Tax=Tamlana sp. 2201CG12-4 TaxID=3112582 RepID=UPI002DB5F997|nr:DUF4861 family protein [Tamlana sp. 2201CG12-4]MEC3907053.1 DUF4861 family protein [Tamlana sp. 2201CG12-4]